MGSNSDSGARWYAVTVRSRHEKAVAAALHNKSIEAFLPLYRSRRFWSDRTREVELPLISGYLFCRFALRSRLPILTTPGVTSIVSFGDAPAALEDKEIDDLKTLVGSGFPIRPWPFLNAGQRISIERGPLKGLEGIILRIKDSYHLVASVFILQRSVAVEVDAAFVRPHPARLGIA